MHHGLDGREYSLKEIGQYLDREGNMKKEKDNPLSKERVRQIINKAESKMRHGSRSTRLKIFY